MAKKQKIVRGINQPNAVSTLAFPRTQLSRITYLHHRDRSCERHQCNNDRSTSVLYRSWVVRTKLVETTPFTC
jgi:hypothetical protein